MDGTGLENIKHTVEIPLPGVYRTEWVFIPWAAMSAPNLCRAQTCSCSFQHPVLPELRSPNPEWLKTCPVWRGKIEMEKNKWERNRPRKKTRFTHRNICTGRPKRIHQIYKPFSEQTVPLDVANLTTLILHSIFNQLKYILRGLKHPDTLVGSKLRLYPHRRSNLFQNSYFPWHVSCKRHSTHPTEKETPQFSAIGKYSEVTQTFRD